MVLALLIQWHLHSDVAHMWVGIKQGGGRIQSFGGC